MPLVLPMTAGFEATAQRPRSLSGPALGTGDGQHRHPRSLLASDWQVGRSRKVGTARRPRATRGDCTHGNSAQTRSLGALDTLTLVPAWPRLTPTARAAGAARPRFSCSPHASAVDGWNQLPGLRAWARALAKSELTRPLAPNSPLLLTNAAFGYWHLRSELGHGAAGRTHSLGGCAPIRPFRFFVTEQAAFAAEQHVRLISAGLFAERERTIERTRAGMERAKRAGKVSGRPRRRPSSRVRRSRAKLRYAPASAP